MRIALEIVPVLERTRLALINIDRHHPRPFFAAHDAPFAPRRETGAAQTEAVRLYERCGYARRAAFGGYPDNGLSRFYAKVLG
jgi:hypothetical protein